MARARKTPEEFAAQMAELAPTIELCTPYVDARTKVACRCRVCGSTWEATPNHLLRGAGCPTCAGTARVSGEAFAARAAQTAPLVEILTPYVNARTRVDCRCTVCGACWSPYPRSLLQGHGCPACAERAATDRLRAAAEASRSNDPTAS